MRKKQGILVIADGMGDRPIEVLGGLTPLEYAKTPSLDFLASKGACGNVHPYAPGVRVGTDVGHLAIFGYDPKKVYTGRGPIEAYGDNFELEDGDIAFRGNFSTIDDDFTVIDRRAGRISSGTKELVATLNGMVLSNGTKVFVIALTAHRVAVILRGKNLSTKITITDPGTAMEGEKLVKPQPLDDSKEAKNTAMLVWELTQKIYDILKVNNLNIQREKEGKLSANMILLRGVGIKPNMPKLSEQMNIKCACVAGEMTVIGVAKMAGMDTFMLEGFNGEYDTDFMGKAKLGVKLLKEDKYDWVVIHIKATDLAGHDNLPYVKVDMAEKIDLMMAYILKNIDLNDCYVSFTADHSTPCELKDHSGDPVPTIIAGGDIGIRRDDINQCGEKYFKNGSLNNLRARDIFMIQMDLMGFTKKFGS